MFISFNYQGLLFVFSFSFSSRRKEVHYSKYSFKLWNNPLIFHETNLRKLRRWYLSIFSQSKNNSSRPDTEWREKIKLNFYFHSSLCCLKRFYEGLKGLMKIFWSTTKKCENISIRLSEVHVAGRVKDRLQNTFPIFSFWCLRVVGNFSVLRGRERVRMGGLAPK